MYQPPDKLGGACFRSLGGDAARFLKISTILMCSAHYADCALIWAKLDFTALVDTLLKRFMGNNYGN